MKRIARTILASLVVSTTGLTAQQAPAASPDDVKSADAIVRAAYEANSIMVDQNAARTAFAPSSHRLHG